MHTALGAIVIILLLLAVIWLWCIGMFGPIFAIICLVLGRKRKRWLVSGLILLPLCLMVLIGLIGFDFPMGYVGLERKTYEKTAVQVKQQDIDDGAFTADGVHYERLDLTMDASAFDRKITEPIFYVRDRDKSYALFRNYGYNFYRVPNEAGLDIVISERDYDLYCPTDQKEAALAYYNDPARR